MVSFLKSPLNYVAFKQQKKRKCCDYILFKIFYVNTVLILVLITQYCSRANIFVDSKYYYACARM